MEMVRATILKEGINDTLWPKVVFAMIYIKNLRPTQALNKLINPAKIQDKDLTNKDFSNFYHLRVLRSIIYVFFCKKEGISKAAK